MSSPVIRRNLGPCLICSRAAIAINFGVPTCAPCKAFFRRNAVKLGKVSFICRDDGDCPVASGSHHLCNCCRLAKCFRVGMQRALILSETEKESRKDMVRQNREKRAQLDKKIRTSRISHLPTNRSRDLLATDQALLTNIFGAYKQTHTLPDNAEYPVFPRMEHSFVHTLHNEYEERYKLFIEYCKLVPEFERLSMNDKRHLLKNQLVETIMISNMTLSKYISVNLSNSLRNIYGLTLFDDVKGIAERLIAYKYDPVILKLLLIIQTLFNHTNRCHESENRTPVYDCPSAILAGQNVYIELLWRYLLSRAPSEQDAVKFYNKLILDLLLLQRVCSLVERHIRKLDHEIERMTPLMQTLWLM